MASALVDQVIEGNPCAGVKLPRDDDKREMTFLTPEEVARLADTIDPRYRMLILTLTLAYSGCRIGELAFIRVDSVNILSGQLTIKGSLAEVGGKVIPQPTKSGKWRTVTLPRSLAQQLGEHIRPTVRMARWPDDYLALLNPIRVDGKHSGGEFQGAGPRLRTV